MRAFPRIWALTALALVAPALAAAPKPAPARAARLDLADTAAGTYRGDVISDARGASRDDVTITVVKTAPNTVRVSSSYDRLPPFTVRLTRAMQTIQQVGTAQVFLLDLAKSPRHLDVTVDDASWSGDRQE